MCSVPSGQFSSAGNVHSTLLVSTSLFHSRSSRSPGLNSVFLYTMCGVEVFVIVTIIAYFWG